MGNRPEILMTFEDRQRLTELIATELSAGRCHAVIFLANEISRARTVPAAFIPPTCMTLNAQGRYLDERTGLVRACTLVLPGQQRASLNMVSVLSDLGTALLGLSVGQRMAWHCRVWGDRSIQLLGILHQPEWPRRGQGTSPLSSGHGASDGRDGEGPAGPGQRRDRVS